jgi:hypothetical protein
MPFDPAQIRLLDRRELDDPSLDSIFFEVTLPEGVGRCHVTRTDAARVHEGVTPEWAANRLNWRARSIGEHVVRASLLMPAGEKLWPDPS